ncbi:unnamed protein product, partial [Choristocarpus tenellus]
MTVLCAAGRSFAGMDLSKIKVPGSIMDGGIFDGCSLSGADITSCSLQGASLGRCNLDDARCRGLLTGALPVLQPMGGAAMGLAKLSMDGSLAAIIASDGTLVVILDVETGKEVCSFAAGSPFRRLSMGLLELSPNGAFVVVESLDQEDDMPPDKYSSYSKHRHFFGGEGDGGSEIAPTPSSRFTVAQKGEPRGRYLELHRVSDGFLLFEAVTLRGSPSPTFSRDSSLLLHQHGENSIGVVDCASGDSADLMELSFEAGFKIEEDLWQQLAVRVSRTAKQGAGGGAGTNGKHNNRVSWGRVSCSHPPRPAPLSKTRP